MTHAELLRGNRLGIGVPSCDGEMVLVQVHHVAAIGELGLDEPRVIKDNRCRKCGEHVMISGREVVETGAEDSVVLFDASRPALVTRSGVPEPGVGARSL